MQVSRYLLPVAAMLAMASAPSWAAAPAPEGKPVVTKLSELPTHSYPMSAKPSVLVRDPAAVRSLAAAIGKDVRSELADYDIRDTTTVRRLHGTLLTVALLRGDDAEALKQVGIVRGMQEKPAARLVSGRITEALVAARRGPAGDFDATLQSHLEKALGALPWEVVQDELKSTKAYLEYASEGLVIGGLENSLDPPAEKAGALSQQLADNILGAAYTLTFILPHKQALLAAYTAVVDAHKKARKPDIWAARDVTLEPGEKLSPVTVAIWDSGVDFSIPAIGRQAWTNTKEVAGDGKDDDDDGYVDDVHGIGFTLHSDYTPKLLYPVRDVVPDPEQFQQYLKGFSDLQANIDSPEATELKQKLASLPKDEFKPFVEGLSAYANYAHGTHVTGIAIAGDPAARVMAARITFDYRIIGDRPTIAQAYKDAYASVATIDYFVAHGVKVVNMSWGGDLASIETALEQTGAPGTPDERRALARRIYDIGYKALADAMRDAPNILFVIAAGNSDNNVKFDEVMPSSIKLPNVMVVGAVDQAGDEASFTSFGNSDLYADGFEVESYVPGGARLKFSGTSMAAPNVTNLAAKLWALHPALTVAQVKQLIVDGADDKKVGDRTIKLLDPKRSVELAAGTAGK